MSIYFLITYHKSHIHEIANIYYHKSYIHEIANIYFLVTSVLNKRNCEIRFEANFLGGEKDLRDVWDLGLSLRGNAH